MKRFYLCFLMISWFMILPFSASAQTPGEADSIGLEERIRRLEQAVTPGSRSEEPGNAWFERVHLTTLIEVEADSTRIKYRDPEEGKETNSDVDLAKVEVGLDLDIAKYVTGHVLFKYDGDDDDLFVDEGFITLDGGERLPAYLIAGRQYLPFGAFDSYFITDPNTLTLGETNEGAVVAGYRIGGELVDISLGAFKGDAQKAGRDRINSWVAAVDLRPSENLTFRLAYTSNLGASTALNDELTDPDHLDRLVGGFSAFARFDFLERFRLIGEYVSAVRSFKPGELFDDSEEQGRKPAAWNFELGAALTDDIELAVRYGGADDCADFIPKAQYGAVVSWECFKYTTLSLEYLHAKYDGEIKHADSVTAQLAILF